MALAELACSVVEKVESLTAVEEVASLNLAPRRCGRFLDIVSIQEWTAWGGPFRDPSQTASAS